MNDNEVGNKYDRQVRLWNPNGQRCLANSSMCLINANTTASETLKNLVLPGVGKLVIVDDGRQTTDQDLASNFFLRDNAIRSVRAVEMAHTLGQLNPDVHVEAEIRPLDQLLDEPQYWSQFNCVMVSSFLESPELHQALSNLLWNQNICLIEVNSIGFYATLHIQYKEQDIIETHDNSLDDLRLDLPWPELQKHIDSIDLDQLDDQAFSNVPYSIILTKVYQKLVSTSAEFSRPVPSTVRNFVQSELRRTGDETNLEEACNRAILVLKNSKEIPGNLKEIFEDDELDCGDRFWVLVKALKIFYNNHGVLPLSGVLPDMESDTVNYMALTKLYREKFNDDKKELRGYIEDKEMFTDSELSTFVKNCRYMQVLRGSRKLFSGNLLVENENNPRMIHNLNIYVAFLAVKSFYERKHRFPNLKDRAKLRTVAISLLCRYQNVKNFPEGLEKVLDEICRYNGNEMHNTCALIGGVAAQEVIKVLTNQYVTLDNCLSYDGVNCEVRSWSIGSS
ncbi:hypothetical protein FOA43_004549 [Brettanomyces nanus]|uniref:NEDD8-activating enzyme E1 regulatory subunit n=1 Tax=Eeniella nana TaxID=13502 RepID=A0A875SAS1_EENNA|nr:uncharacterized protein FOA43_004549 [Brettanomyces nanus]QPG77145.1 hypothetical protein FOA43_004549 [Brettanomyces nanus]